MRRRRAAGEDHPAPHLDGLLADHHPPLAERPSRGRGAIPRSSSHGSCGASSRSWIISSRRAARPRRPARPRGVRRAARSRASASSSPGRERLGGHARPEGALAADPAVLHDRDLQAGLPGRPAATLRRDRRRSPPRRSCASREATRAPRARRRPPPPRRRSPPPPWPGARPGGARAPGQATASSPSAVAGGPPGRAAVDQHAGDARQRPRRAAAGPRPATRRGEVVGHDPRAATERGSSQRRRQRSRSRCAPSQAHHRPRRAPAPPGRGRASRGTPRRGRLASPAARRPGSRASSGSSGPPRGKPVDSARRVVVTPANTSAHPLRVALRVGQPERDAPRDAEHEPAVDAEVRPQPLQVGDQVSVVLASRSAPDRPVRRAAPAAALVEQDDAVRGRVEEAPLPGRAARARAAVEHDGGLAAGFPHASQKAVAVPDVEPAVDANGSTSGQQRAHSHGTPALRG